MNQEVILWSAMMPYIGLSWACIGSQGQKIKFAQNFLYTKSVRYHVAILWGFEAKIVFGAKQVGKLQIPDFTLSVGQKNQIDFVWSKSSLR